MYKTTVFLIIAVFIGVFAYMGIQKNSYVVDKNDIVIFEYSTTIEGTADKTDLRSEYDMASDEQIYDFNEKFLGQKEGKTGTAKFTIDDENYSEEQQGKEIKYSYKIIKIQPVK